MTLTEQERDAIFERYQRRLVASGVTLSEAREAATVAFEGGDVGLVDESGEFVPDWPPWLRYDSYDAWEARADALIAAGVDPVVAEEQAAGELPATPTSSSSSASGGNVMRFNEPGIPGT